jgi:glucose/arabinose dehydrogenase/PKD repeat protein
MALCVYAYSAMSRLDVQAAPNPEQDGFVDVIALAGLNAPTAVRFSPDGRIFVAEKSGLIKVFDNLSDSQPSIFADLRTNVHNYWDRGLLGLELDPGFPTRPYVYVLYTYDGRIGGAAPRWGIAGQTSDGCPDPPGGTADGCDVSGRLSRLRAAGNVMTGAEEVVIHDWFQQYPSHGMGSLAFGADGALYASAGDGASFQFVDYGQNGNPGGDPPVGVGGVQTSPTAEGGALRSQDVRTEGDPAGLSGSIIRVDPNTGAALATNPWADRSDVNMRRIVAYGFRNPFRMTIRPGTRELWVGDVGWRDWEEINRIADPLSTVVRNFGWPCYEGRARQPGYDPANLNLCESLYAQSGAVTEPYFQYVEGSPLVAGETCPNAESSITGLAFYRGGSYPAAYNGALFFGDYARNCIWVMFPGADGRPDPATRTVFIANAGSPVDMQIGPGGDLFYVDIKGGAIRRVRYSDNQPPIPVFSATPEWGPVPLTVTFDGKGSSDREDSTLTFDWDLNGDGAFGDASIVAPTYTYSVKGNVTARLRVTDSGGLSATAGVAISVGNTPPVATIATPASTLRWHVGQTVSFSGSATDSEQGTLPASALTWALIMNHCSSAASCHEHVIREYAGVSSGSFVAPDHEFPSYLTLRLTATDAGGLTHQVTRRLDPQTVQLTFQTSPPGLRLGVGSGTIVTPATLTFIVGSRISVSAPTPQSIGGTSYHSVSWSDGQPSVHEIVAGTSPVTYLATYAPTTSSVRAEVVMYAARAPVKKGTWRVVTDTTAAGGSRIEHPDAGAAKLTTPLAAPADYFELQFEADAGRAYRLWLRGRAADNSYRNDSVFVQFSWSVTGSGSAANRIGSTNAIPIVLEECGGCPLSGWGWEDNGYGAGVLGTPVYFATTGVQTIRIQGREDGISLDQIVLSASDYLNEAPGAVRQDATILPERPGTADVDVVRYAAAASVIAGSWRLVPDSSAATGARLEHPNVDAPKLEPAANPRDYFELTFTAVAGEPYRLWLRGRAAGNSYRNDSVSVQFSGSIDASGAPVYRIGSTSATAVIIEECSGCGLSGWGWSDNGYGGDGPLIYFPTSGPQRMRIQAREDGISIDQIVLSRGTYLSRAPGATRNDTTILR